MDGGRNGRDVLSVMGTGSEIVNGDSFTENTIADGAHSRMKRVVLPSQPPSSCIQGQWQSNDGIPLKAPTARSNQQMVT
jgi:hypothetical protein